MRLVVTETIGYIYDTCRTKVNWSSSHVVAQLVCNKVCINIKQKNVLKNCHFGMFDLWPYVTSILDIDNIHYVGPVLSNSLPFY